MAIPVVGSLESQSYMGFMGKPQNPMKSHMGLKITARTGAQSFKKSIAIEEERKMSSREVSEADGRLLPKTYERSPVCFVRGSKCRLYDAEGNAYIDMAGGISLSSLGHGDPLWVKSILEQSTGVSHIDNSYLSIPQVKLAERLVNCSFADRVFFCNSGSEANEAAIQFARKYHILKSQEAMRRQPSVMLEPPRTEFLAFTNSFHGQTMGCLSLSSLELSKQRCEPMMPGVRFVEYGDLEGARRVVEQRRTAAVFVEPVQVQGGVHPAIGHFLQGLRALCSDTGTLLVFDEVECGLGRTGKLWGHEVYGVHPDMMSLGQGLSGGLPIGAVLLTEAVSSTINPGDYSSSFSGNPVICNASLEVLNRLDETDYLDNVSRRGDMLRTLLTEKLAPFKHVKEVRGVGLLVGVQLDVPAKPVVTAALNRGLLVLTAGVNGDIIRLTPPLIIVEELIQKSVDILVNAMRSVW